MNLWRSRVNTLISLMLAMLTALSAQLGALDIPVFYRTPFFQGQPAPSQDDWTAYFSVHYAYADTRKAFDAHSNSVSLFSSYGFFDIGKLGVNLENLANKPKTNELWGAGMPFEKGPNVPVEFSGKFRVGEFDLTWRQNIMAGFFAEVYLPVKWLHCDQINFINRGDDVVEMENIDDFLNNKLDPILNENGFEAIKNPYNKSGFGDPVICAGWQSPVCTEVGFIDSMVGQLKLGALLPLTGKRALENAFAIPLGHDQFLGVVGRGNLEAVLWKYFHFGVSAGTVIFFTEERVERVATSKGQQGWIFLEKTKVKKDQGSIWDVMVYAQGQEVIGALSALVGFSYTTQERTVLSVRDDNYLKTFIASQKALTPPVIVSQNDVANSNAQLAKWDQYVVHFLLEYDFYAHKQVWFAPKFSLAYDWAVYGKRAFQANMLGGAVAFQIQFNF